MIFKKNLTMYSYHYNHQDSVAVLTDKYGNLAQHLQYLPYDGIFVVHRLGSYSSTYTFSVKENDSESGVFYSKSPQLPILDKSISVQSISF